MTENKEDYGKTLEYEPEFQGPRKYRRCTDVACIYLLVVFILVWIGIGIFAFVKGDPANLTRAGSVSGFKCGKDKEVLDKKYSLYMDLLKCADDVFGCSGKKICVAECPKEEFLFQQTGDDYSKVLCAHGYNPKSNNEAAKFIKDGFCAEYYFPSKAVFNTCVPTRINSPHIIRYLMSKNNEGNKTVTDDLSKSKKALQASASSQETGNEILSDLKHGSGYLIGAIIIAILATIIYIGVMRWIAGVMVWLSLIIVALAFVAGTIGTFYMYFTYKPRSEQDNNKSSFLIGGIIFLVLLIVFVIALIFMRKRIKLAIVLIKESSKAVGDMISTLFFPILPSIIQILFVFFGISIAVYLCSIGEPFYKTKHFNSLYCKCSGEAVKYGNNTECVPKIFHDNCFKDPITREPCVASCDYAGIKQSAVIYVLHAFNVFTTYWTMFFIYAFVEMVLAGAFATWYWTMPKSNLESYPLSNSLSRTFKYHLGTIAFGSLIITIIRIIRKLLDMLEDSLKKSDSGFARILVSCLECLFDWLERVMKFINRNAYILTAVHGYNFCKGAREAFSLIMRNILRVYVLDTVTDFLLAVSKILLTICVSCIGYVMIMYISSHKFEYPAILIILIAIFTYVIASVFFNVFSMAVDTLFICYLEDSERNDGSAERPYFMSHKLSKVFAKED